MARKSAAALAIMPAKLPNETMQEPDDLSADELRMWREIVASKPSDWWGPDSAPILKEYVRAASMCDVLDRRVKEVIRRGDPEQIKFFLDLRDKESRRAMSLATKMRLTQQSRYGARAADTAARKAHGRRPWESEG